MSAEVAGSNPVCSIRVNHCPLRICRPAAGCWNSMVSYPCTKGSGSKSPLVCRQIQNSSIQPTEDTVLAVGFFYICRYSIRRRCWWRDHLRGCAAPVNQKQFYKSTPWKRARQAYIDKRLAIDGGICELCHEEPGYIVHHFKVWLDDINCNDPEIALNEDNFQYVCLTCHNKEADPRRETPGRCRYGPNGEILRNSLY